MKQLLLGIVVVASMSTLTGIAQTIERPAAEPWPGTVANLPTQPKACWLTGDECYPEIRNFIEGQWHDSLTDTRSLDEAKHLHVGCAFPYETKGILRLDCRVVAFHWQGGVFKSIRGVKINTCPGCPRLLPAPYSPRLPGVYNTPITEHIQEFYVPIYIDTRYALRDGPAKIEMDAGFQFVDANRVTRMASASLEVGIYLRNGKPCSATPCPPPRPYGSMAMAGWIDDTNDPLGTRPFGYLRIAADNVRRFDAAPWTMPVKLFLTALPFHLNTVLIAQNPDLHTHPPDYGAVLVDQTPTMTVAYKRGIPTKGSARVSLDQPFQVAGDRLLIRLADFTPDPNGGVTTAGASLLAVTLGKGQ